MLENDHRAGSLHILVQYTKWIHVRSKNRYLHACREADEICAESKAGTLTSRNANRRGNRIQDGKHNGGENGEGGDLIHREGLLGDKDGRGGNHETLDQILNNAVNNFSKSVAHHVSIFSLKKKTHLNSDDSKQGNEFKA